MKVGLMLEDFKQYIVGDGNYSKNTVQSYYLHIKNFLKWFDETYSLPFEKLHRQNVLEYISYLKNILEQKPSTINAKIAALIKLNEFLQDNKIQDYIVVSKKDQLHIQSEGANPSKVIKKEVEQFRQLILEKEGVRNHAIVTIMAYAGLRISETLSLKKADVNLTAKEIIVRYGKGKKTRLVYINDKIVHAVKEYLKAYNKPDYQYLFPAKSSDKPLDRTAINRVFNKYSNKLTPHDLRHFYCTIALEEGGYSIHEVANQAGHSNIHTTLRYTNPTAEEMKKKANRL